MNMSPEDRQAWQEANSTQHSLLGAAGEGALDGVQVVLDKFNPFGNPFEEAGAYDTSRSDIQFSQKAGSVAAWTAPAGGGLKVLTKLSKFKPFRFLNQNKFFRIGPGKIKGAGPDKVPRISIGNKKPSWWNHWRL